MHMTKLTTMACIFDQPEIVNPKRADLKETEEYRRFPRYSHSGKLCELTHVDELYFNCRFTNIFSSALIV